MYCGKTILALIPARGASKGIPRKNIRPLGGKPLIRWTIEAAQGSDFIDRVILSSEDEEIIEIAQKAGCEVPFVRPERLARDDSTSMEVILHALEQLENEFDYLLLLQPTSPFRSSHDIDGIIHDCVESRYKMMVSVSKTKKHPMYMYELVDGRLKPFFQPEKEIRRQDMPVAYAYNGALYLAEITFLREVQSYNVPEARPYKMAGYSCIDIDEPEDLIYAAFLFEKGIVEYL